MVYRNLHDAIDLILNGIFRGENFSLDAIHLTQRTVKSGRLA